MRSRFEEYEATDVQKREITVNANNSATEPQSNVAHSTNRWKSWPKLQCLNVNVPTVFLFILLCILLIRQTTFRSVVISRTSPNGPSTGMPERQVLNNLPNCSAGAGRAQTFLMIFQGHSGSTAIMSSLKQHSQTYITGYEPIDHPPFTNSTPREKGTADALQYTEAFFQNGTRKNLTTGFKARPTHLLANPEAFHSLVKKYDTRVIWSYRGNILKQAIGDYRIHYYNDDHSYEGLRVDANGRVRSPANRASSIRINDMHKLHAMVKLRANADRVLTTAVRRIARGDCILPVSYETYLKYPDLTLEHILSFLGLNSTERPAARRAKANRDSLCELVENFDEVCQAFFGCVEYRWMLDDIEQGCSCKPIQAPHINSTRQYCSVYTPVL